MRSWLKESQVKDISDTDAAWLAGMFDGEGSIVRYMGGRNGKYLSWAITIPNTHYGSLRRLQRITGVGSINEKPRQKAHHKRNWHWKVSSQKEIADILGRIRPYATIKCAQIARFFRLWKGNVNRLE